MTKSHAVLCLFLASAGASILAAPSPRTVSTSRQFIVFGEDIRLRGSVAQFAEQVKTELLSVVQVPDKWTVPVLVNLLQPQANLPELPPVALNFSQTGAGLKIQLDLVMSAAFEPTTLRREVLRALLLEMSYRGLPSLPAGEVYHLPPDWLVEGLLFYKAGALELPDAFQNATEHPPSLENFLALRPALLDSQSRALYGLFAGSLLKSVLSAPGGRAQLVRYITDLPRASADAMTELREHFPSLGRNAEEAEKKWRASLAQTAHEQRFGLTAFAATAQLLEEALQTPVAYARDGNTALNLEQAAAAFRPRIDKQGARALAERLIVLEARANPVLRGIVMDYQRAAEALASGHMRGVAKRLAQTAALKARVAARMRDVDDYMNWYEATQAQTISATFLGYGRAAEGSEITVRRHDPLSVYLDAMENEVR